MTARELVDILLEEKEVVGTKAYLASGRDAAVVIVNRLLADEPLARTALAEATVHRPRRSRVWVATFTGPTGGQVWRTTRLFDREQALVLAKSWEAKARAQRIRSGR